jgi:Transglycosylase SLT domain
MGAPGYRREPGSHLARRARSGIGIALAFTALHLWLLCSGFAAMAAEALGAIDGEAPTAGARSEFDGAEPLAIKPPDIRPLTPADLPPPNVFAPFSVPHRAGADFSWGWRAGRSEYGAIIERESRAYGLPPALLDAVMSVESSYDPAVVGMDGEIGLMQVLPSTARMLGFIGTPAQLADPEVNIHYGAKYLAGAWRLAGQDVCTTTMKYRAGYGETRFSFRSVDYCARVRDNLAAHGVQVAGALPQATFGAATAPRNLRRTFLRGATVDLAALNGQLQALTDRLQPRNTR